MSMSRVSNPQKKKFQLSPGLNLESLNKIFEVKSNLFEPRLKFKPRLKFFKFGLRIIKKLMFKFVFFLNGKVFLEHEE